MTSRSMRQPPDCQARCRIDHVIDGALITFVDITETKALESRLRKDSTG